MWESAWFAAGTFVGFVARALRPELGRFLITLLNGPRLELDCQPEQCLLEFAIGNTSASACYWRMRVVNKKKRTARKCQAHLIKVERLVDGNWVDQQLKDSQQLIWSYDELIDTADVPLNVSKYFDLAIIHKDRPGLLPQIRKSGRKQFVPLFDQKVFAEYGTYRFHVIVSADEINAKTGDAIITHRQGEWPPHLGIRRS